MGRNSGVGANQMDGINEAKLRYQVYSRLYPRPGYSLPLAGSFPCSGHQHSSSGRHLLSPMRCMFSAALRSLSTHMPGCGAGFALTALPLPFVGLSAGSALVRLLRLAGSGPGSLQEDDTDDYGPPIIPETAVADAIMKRTEDHLRRLGGATVSAKPIVMKVEYAYCPNLTIIDTPGFILKVFVASKFDNRLKEFAERWEIDKYLAATGYLPSNVRPFFVALPKDRAIQSSSDWRKQMSEVDVSITKHMREGIKGGFDEERFASRIGFNNLKNGMWHMRTAAPHTLSVLVDRVESAARELQKAEAELRAAEDVAAVRATAMRFSDSVSSGVQQLLEGSTDPDPAQHGMTTEEERTACRAGAAGWPGTSTPVVPPNAGLKLFGGAAFERCLHEFQEAAHALRFPAAVATDRVANLLLAYKGRSAYMASSRAAEDIARQMAREVLGPLLDMACARLAFVLRRMFDIAVDRATALGSSKETLRPHVAFHATLRGAYQAFLSRLEEGTRGVLRQTLDAATSEFAVNLLASIPDVYPPETDMAGNGSDEEGEAPNGSTGRMLDNTPSKRAVKSQRVQQQQQLSHGRFGMPYQSSSQGGEGYDEVIQRAERLFNRLRYSVAQQSAPTSLKAAFLDPLKARLGLEVALDLFARSDTDFMSMFASPSALQALQVKRDSLQKRTESLLRLKNEFQELSKAPHILSMPLAPGWAQQPVVELACWGYPVCGPRPVRRQVQLTWLAGMHGRADTAGAELIHDHQPVRPGMSARQACPPPLHAVQT
ncbi:hypothetical protein QJQ45_018742 [Haematococcus lacustris]|nr:hypothetical protein QJQ45_018742 [Haematococcus lacustris]